MNAFTHEWYEQHQARMRAQRAPASAREGASVSLATARPKSPANPVGNPAGGEAGEGTCSPQFSKPKRKLQRPEQDLHKACIRFLDAAMLPYWRVVHAGNGGVRSPIEAAIMVGMGVRKGFPDLLFLGPGRFVVMELKAQTRGSLSQHQKEWRDWFQKIGAQWFLVRSLDELEAACQDAGIPLRVRAA